MMKDKILWLKTFLELSESIAKRSSELFFRSIQIPRKTSWRDSFINEILDIADKQRVVYDEIMDLYAITIIKDIDDLLDKIEAEIAIINKMKEENTNQQKIFYVKLEDKRNKFLEALRNNNTDPWLCETEMKNNLKEYLESKTSNDYETKIKDYELEKKYKEYNNAFQNIVKNFLKIQSNFNEKLFEIVNIQNIEKKIMENYEEVYYDFQDNEASNHYEESEKENQVKEEAFKNEYKNIIDQIIVALSLEGKEFFSSAIHKSGIFKYKKGSKDWKVGFFVLTNSKFMHGFDVELILKNNLNLKAEYPNIIKRIYGNNNKKISYFFESHKSDSLNLKEEIELINLCEAIKKSTNYVDFKIYNFSFKTSEKAIRLDKEKYEISFTNKNTNSFTNFFLCNAIKIKAFILKDLYELYFGMIKKEEELISKIVELKEEEEVKIEKVVENSAVNWQSFDEENPWNDA